LPNPVCAGSGPECISTSTSSTHKLRLNLCYGASANCRGANQQRKLLPTTDSSTHWHSIASASVSLTTRTGRFSSSASFAALRRRALATTSYLRSSSSRTRRGARIPCALMLAAFRGVHHFVAEDAQRRVEMVVRVSEGHIMCDSRNLTVHTRRENASRLSDSANLTFWFAHHSDSMSLQTPPRRPIRF